MHNPDKAKSRSGTTSKKKPARRLTAHLNWLELRSVRIPIRVADKLKKENRLDLIDTDELWGLEEKYSKTERTIWSGVSVNDVLWNDHRQEIDQPQKRPRYRAIKFDARSAELVRFSRDYVSCFVDLLSPFEPSKLTAAHSYHRLGKTLRWEFTQVRYGDEEFDEYEWADGSQPWIYGDNGESDYFLIMRTPRGYSVTRLG